MLNGLLSLFSSFVHFILGINTPQSYPPPLSQKEEVQEGKIPVYLQPDFTEAVKLACTVAQSGDIVLLSPACASFDRFKNFEVRGEHFKKLVNSF